METGAVFGNETGGLDLGPDTGFTQEGVAVGQEGFADAEAREGFFFEDNRAESGGGGAGGGGTAGGPRADHQHVVIISGEGHGFFN